MNILLNGIFIQMWTFTAESSIKPLAFQQTCLQSFFLWDVCQAGLTDNGLPSGFQLVAPPFEEALLFRTARAFEKGNPWSYPEWTSG